MKIYPAVRLVAVLLLCFMTAAQAAWDPNKSKKADETIAAFQEADPGLEAYFEEAHGYAVFPTVGKGGIGIGGARGKGVVYEHGKPVGRTTLTQLSIGFQWGGQAYSEVIFFEDQAAIDRFKTGKFELGAQVSAVAATLGASADAAYESGVAIFTVVKGGLMYEASVGGQKFSYKPNK